MPGTRAVIDLSGGELAFAQKYIWDFKLNTWLADRDSSYRISSPSANVVRIGDGDITHQLDITLDPASFLPTKVTSISLADPAHPIPSDEVTTEWTAVNSGLQHADLAAKPPDFRPVLSTH